MNKKYNSFEEFWPFYLSQHSQKSTRFLHALGVFLSFGLVVAVVDSGQYRFLWLAPVLGYGPAWIGHFFFEHNIPATFKNPIYSLMGDFKMIFLMAAGKI